MDVFVKKLNELISEDEHFNSLESQLNQKNALLRLIEDNELEESGLSLSDIPVELKNDKDVVHLLLKKLNGFDLNQIINLEYFNGNYDLLKNTLMNYDDFIFSEINDNEIIKSDFDFIEKQIQIYVNKLYFRNGIKKIQKKDIVFLMSLAKKNKELMLFLLKTNAISSYEKIKYFNKKALLSFKKDKDIFLELIDLNILFAVFIKNFKEDIGFIEKCLHKNENIYYFLPKDILLNPLLENTILNLSTIYPKNNYFYRKKSNIEQMISSKKKYFYTAKNEIFISKIPLDVLDAELINKILLETPQKIDNINEDFFKKMGINDWIEILKINKNRVSKLNKELVNHDEIMSLVFENILFSKKIFEFERFKDDNIIYNIASINNKNIFLFLRKKQSNLFKSKKINNYKLGLMLGLIFKSEKQKNNNSLIIEVDPRKNWQPYQDKIIMENLEELFSYNIKLKFDKKNKIYNEIFKVLLNYSDDLEFAKGFLNEETFMFIESFSNKICANLDVIMCIFNKINKSYKEYSCYAPLKFIFLLQKIDHKYSDLIIKNKAQIYNVEDLLKKIKNKEVLENTIDNMPITNKNELPKKINKI